MSTTTANFGLTKPDLTDAADITQMNKNWDIVDEQLREINEKASAESIIEQNKRDKQKFWVGTKAEYDAIETKDPNTSYTVTDEEDKLTASDVGAAPAGYGLGGNARGIKSEAIDTTKNNGWYAIHFEGGISLSGIPMTFASMRVDNWENSNSVRQTLYPAINYNTVLTRECFNGVWGDWCCENPPMLLGVEYRTTERWKGKPVYIKAVNIGTLSATANELASVDSSVFGNGVDDIVDIGGSIKDGSWSGVLPYFSNAVQIYVFANKTGIAVWSTKDGNSCYTATVWVKYTKS